MHCFMSQRSSSSQQRQSHIEQHLSKILVATKILWGGMAIADEIIGVSQLLGACPRAAPTKSAPMLTRHKHFKYTCETWSSALGITISNAENTLKALRRIITK